MSSFVNIMEKQVQSCINLLGYETDSLRYIYLQQRLFSDLKEAYSSLNTIPNNFKSSLIVAIKSIQSNNISDQSDIIDELNKEFLFVNVTFEYKEKSQYGYRPKFEKVGIIDGMGDKSGVEITVNDTFINLLRNPDILNDQNTLNTITEALFSLYGHETTHEEQTNKEKIPVPAPNIHPNMTEDEVKAYYSNTREIASHAREVADRLLLSGKSLKDIEQLLTTWKGTTALCAQDKTFLQYYTLFGIGLRLPKASWKDTTEKDLEIFNRFKKYITYFLRLDIQFINKNTIPYLLKNKPEK